MTRAAARPRARSRLAGRVLASVALFTGLGFAVPASTQELSDQQLSRLDGDVLSARW